MNYGFKTTTRGREVLAACMALKKPPDICRVAFGGGKISETANLADQHELLEYVAEGTVGNRSHKGNHLCFTIQYANSEHPDVKTFYLSEFIVYIKDPETGEDADLLYGTLGDYRQPVPQNSRGAPPCVWNLPLVLVLSDELEVKISAPPGLVTYDDLGVPGGAVSLDEAGRIPEIQMPWKHRVTAARPRDPGKPDYGVGGGGEDGGSVVLETGPYTGETEAGVVVSGILYDAKNMSTHGDTAPDGTIIIKTEEQKNGCRRYGVGGRNRSRRDAERGPFYPGCCRRCGGISIKGSGGGRRPPRLKGRIQECLR